MATALIVIPIAVAAALELGVSPQPVLMSVTVAAAASYLTPVATPVNMMVMGPGGYRFGDYWKLGLPLLALFVRGGGVPGARLLAVLTTVAGRVRPAGGRRGGAAAASSPTTLTDDSAIAAAAKTGLSRIPKAGYRTPIATGISTTL